MIASAGERNLWVFADAGLLDELHVTVVPVVLGAGEPLFDRGLHESLQLAGTRRFANGMVGLRYEVKPPRAS
jgi:dihydrofolate reductase